MVKTSEIQTSDVVAFLRSTIELYEEYCDSCKGLSDDARALFEIIEQLFDELGLEKCAHNAAILGSKENAGYKIPGVNRLLTPYEYKKIVEKED